MADKEGAMDRNDPAFQQAAWSRRLLSQPKAVYFTLGCRTPKEDSTEDSFFAETLKTDRTIKSCVAWYEPSETGRYIDCLNVLMDVGDGVNGHSGVMQGGVVAGILDTCFATLSFMNTRHAHSLAKSKGQSPEQAPIGCLTAFLTVNWKQPVRTPGLLLVITRYTKSEGRKDWMSAEVKQRYGVTERDEDGVEYLCATGEALMIEPKIAPRL